MKFKKAFTLAEILIVLMIMAVLILIILRTIKPSDYDEKANIAHGQKLFANIENAAVQLLANETTQCPAGSFMVKPAGGSFEFATKKADGTAADAAAIVDLFGGYLKYETESLNFCDYTASCSDTISGAKLAGGAYIGFVKYDSIKDCPEYFIAGDETKHPAPKSFDNGAFVNKKCWGEVRIDVNGKKGPDTEGKDVFIYGLGEYGIEK